MWDQVSDEHNSSLKLRDSLLYGEHSGSVLWMLRQATIYYHYFIYLFYYNPFLWKGTRVSLLNDIMHMFCLLFIVTPSQRGLLNEGKISSPPPLAPPSPFHSNLFPTLLIKTSTWRFLCTSRIHMCNPMILEKTHAPNTTKITSRCWWFFAITRSDRFGFYYPKCSGFGCLNSTL